MGVSINGGTHKSPLFNGIFPNKNHPFGGTPMTMETLICSTALSFVGVLPALAAGEALGQIIMLRIHLRLLNEVRLDKHDNTNNM